MGGRQAKGVLRGKETKGKRNKNSPLILQRREGRAGSRGICAEVGPEAQTSPATQPQMSSPETPVSPPHTAAQVLTTELHVGGQAHRPRAHQRNPHNPGGPAGGPAHLLADHHRPGVTRGLVRAQLLPDTPVTPPAAAHTGLAPARSTAMGQASARGSPGSGGRGGWGRDSLRRRAELSDGYTVIDREPSFGNHHSTEPELHAHGHVVCKVGERARAEEWG